LNSLKGTMVDEERIELLARVASMYYEDELTQNEISANLGYSRSCISRMLTEARREGIVEIQIHHPLERKLSLEKMLRDRFDLNEVRVIESNGSPYPQILRRFGAVTARLLEEKVTESTTLGISWGTALYEVAHALRPTHFPGVKVVQMIGSSSSSDHQVDGPGLARAFARQFDGRYYTLPAPWLVEDRNLRDALMNDRRLREVLRLTRQIDIAVVGIGTINPSLSSLLRAGYLTIEETRSLQTMGVVGDVCGQHFNLEGFLMEIPLAGYVFGIEVEALRSIPLVIGVAGGVAKAPAILGAVRSRLINSLVTDDEAARDVLELSSR
jgi:DNA-binding transcriptional regulator LsrR (DeoR family)